jgi:hypothetical protein
MVAWDHARDLRAVGDRLTNPHRHLGAGAKPSAAGAVVDLDPDRAHGQQVARLPRPRELLERRAAELSQEDPGERGALALVAALMT